VWPIRNVATSAIRVAVCVRLRVHAFLWVRLLQLFSASSIRHARDSI